MKLLGKIADIFDKIVSTLSDKFGAATAFILIIIAFILIISLIPALAGWAVVTVISLFTTVTISGYWTYVIIGIAVLIVAAILN